MLYLNEWEWDGEMIDYDFVLDREKFINIKMPNEDGFEPNIKGPGALERVRAYFADESNYAGIRLNDSSERCMTDCQHPTAKVVRVQDGGISNFNPPLSAVRDLPVEEAKAIDVVEVYNNACAMCHDSFLSVGDEMWAAYTDKGMDKVYQNGIDGTPGGMPAKGGASMSDDDFKLVVDYLINGK
jgi:cytochrome c